MKLISYLVSRPNSIFKLAWYPRSSNTLGQFGTSARLLSSSTTSLAVAKNEDFFDKNKRLNRPMSPHLTIYAPQITSMLSITHRGTGLALSALTSAFAIGMLCTSTPFPVILANLETLQLGPALIYSGKALLSFPLFFHTFNGIRHLAWDLGKGFQLKDLYTSGYLVVGLSIISSLILAGM